MTEEHRDILFEVMDHYHAWNEDNEKRRTRENGWNDIIDAYNNKLPDNWPYLSRVVDPRIRTSLIEKKARLTNAKLRGRLLPRESSDVLKSRINNTLVDFQWDTATEGGTMNAKWGEMDMDARMFCSKFAYVPWMYEEDDDGKVIRNGNGLTPLDPNNCGLDPNCTHIRNARWFQMREYVTIEDLEHESNVPGIKKYPGLSELKKKIADGVQNPREVDYTARNLTLRGIEDRLGRDKSFPVIEKVIEFRKDEFICFAPKYNLILSQYKNPYKHRKIPIIQLRYYPLINDPIGESEVEAVLPLWRAIQATINGFLDTMNIHMRPPLKILEGQVRMETLQWGPEATWIMNRVDAVTEHAGTGEALRYFQSTYTSLVAAFNQGMGDLSQGVSNIDPFNNDKTATEVKQTVKQQNVRDQDNQSYLADCINDMMSMWVSNNQQFLFSDPKMSEYVLRIVGKQMFGLFQEAGYDAMTVPHESMMAIKEIVDMRGGDMSPDELGTMYQSAEIPKFPVLENPEVKNPMQQTYKPKLRVSDDGGSAELSIIPGDLDGEFDYIADVKSMSIGATQDTLDSQNRLLQTLLNPAVIQLLKEQGISPNVKELIESITENSGLRDAEKYFSTSSPSQGPGQALQEPGLPGAPGPTPPGGEQMAGPANLQVPGGIPGGLLAGMGNGAGIQGPPISA